MTSALFAEDDDGYVGYVETSHDPGYSLLFATILFCIICYCSLPFLVAMGNKLDVKNQQFTAKPSSKGSKLQRRNVSPAEDENDPESMFEARGERETDGGSTVLGVSVAHSVCSTASFHSHRTRKRRNHRTKRRIEKRLEWEEYELRMLEYASRSRNSKHRDISPERSIMGPLDQDEVSVNDAVSLAAATPPRKQIPTIPHVLLPHHTKEINVTDDDDRNFWNTLLDLAVWDFESNRLTKLAIPYATQALSTGILDSLTVAVIGKVLGTKEVSAFVVVRTLVALTSKFFGGFHESIASLCSQARGRHNYKLVGSYVQLSMIFYVVTYIPLIIIWNVYMRSILLWLGFDDETAEIGKDYAQVYLLLELIDGVDESIHAMLDVIDLESYGTLVGVSQEVVTFLDILFITLFAKPSLFVIGMIELFVAIIFIAINLTTIYWRGWFEPYREGLIGSCALYNKQAAKMMLGTASSLSMGYLLTDGEWGILTIFASHLGPAEVAAWGILGVLWDSIERLVEAVADASEVRCAFLLGSAQPAKAKVSAHKSMLLAAFLSAFLVSFVFLAGENLATWFTNDPALQHIIGDLIPLFGVANMALTIGTFCWTLLGSQGRYRLATYVACTASWFVTLPLAALFTFQLRINLQGQTSALVIGYMVQGSINAYYLFRSDWESLSLSVQQANETELAGPAVCDSLESTKLSLECPAVFVSPGLGTLGTLVEGKQDDESFYRESDSDNNPDSAEREIL